MSRRRGRPPALPAAAALLSILATLAVPAAGCGGPRRESLTVVSWGGSYAHAIDKGYLERFAAETGIEIRIEDYNGGLAQVRAQVETGNVHWDVVDLETADAVSGCDEGILERIDSAALPPGPDGAPAMEDFLPGSLFECGIGILFYSTSIPRSTPTTPNASRASRRRPWPTSSTWSAFRAAAGCAACPMRIWNSR